METNEATPAPEPGTADMTINRIIPDAPEPETEVEYEKLPKKVTDEMFHERHKTLKEIGSQAGKPLERSRLQFEKHTATFKALYDKKIFDAQRACFPSAGSHAHLKVGNVDYGTWEEYCVKYIGVTAQYIGQLGRGPKKTRSGGGTGVTKRDAEKPLFKRGWAEGKQEAQEAMVEALRSGQNLPTAVKAVLDEKYAEGIAEGMREVGGIDKAETGEVGMRTAFAPLKKDPARMVQAFNSVIQMFQLVAYINEVTLTRAGKEMTGRMAGEKVAAKIIA